MAINCPKCNAENGDEARFCDQCGAPLAADAAPAAPSSRAAAAPPATNWWAIIGILAIIAVLVWLFATPKGNGQQMPGGGSANPHAADGAASDDNPHGMSSQAGMPDLDAMKAKLDADPLDVASLNSLYQTYGMIGRGPKVREYLDAAMAALLAQREQLGAGWTDTGRQIAAAALLGGDPEGALAALNQLREAAPDDRNTLLLLAQVHYTIDQPAKAVELYDEYLAGSDPVADSGAYWPARLQRATMNLKLYQDSPADGRNTGALAAATAELKEIVANEDANFNAWLQLGNAYGAGGEVEEAEAAYNKCLELAADAQQEWEAQAALAELHGEEPPAQPAPSMGGGTGSMGNPHGGMGSMGNPHGGMGDGGGGTEDPESST